MQKIMAKDTNPYNDKRKVTLQQAVDGKIVMKTAKGELHIYKDFTEFIVTHFYDGKVAAMIMSKKVIQFETDYTATEL